MKTIELASKINFCVKFTINLTVDVTAAGSPGIYLVWSGQYFTGDSTYCAMKPAQQWIRADTDTSGADTDTLASCAALQSSKLAISSTMAELYLV